MPLLGGVDTITYRDCQFPDCAMAVASVTRHSPSHCLREIGRYAVILGERQQPFGTDTRFFIENVCRRGGVWFIRCRNERGIREVEVHPLSADESRAVQEWLGSLPSDVADGLEGAMREILDPRVL